MEMQLGRLALAYRSAMRARFEEHDEFSEWGLRPPSIGALRVVARSGPISQREVSQRLGVHPSDMVRAVDKLEAYGLVSRVRADADRRRYDLTITPKGRKVLDRYSEVSQEVDKDFYGVLSPTEQKQLEKLLSKLVDHHFA
jgi:DNA-binding MarR family transcriptional regulator